MRILAKTGHGLLLVSEEPVKSGRATFATPVHNRSSFESVVAAQAQLFREHIHAHAFQTVPASRRAGRPIDRSCPELACRQYQDRRGVPARRIDRHDRAPDSTTYAA